ncbi:DNA-binding response regulator [Duganella sp. BJB488]|uniref:response regulator transcription factor n=1 Tax=unclassified Duganella TaxID=2636909 RepID=UPI000E3478DA|nr:MULTISPECIES: response regulator transcription factor [unclassified Duganella]RFP09357.1 DNA-binding response regulator [Duganella sp. BJB475]RFP13245.1 DNA-binding response regulator [Duganella sp. BJB489]RFP17180.1 DNA-binding response regulator [Duganella sp. BJB488]RFP25393.1 DNA-binding response regulator [Duganella sp. BJB476]RFP31600.1 DNA-binding response regulator [Duganella sp. BJB480]
MRFAVLTQTQAHFAAIEACFQADGVVCSCFADTRALLRAARNDSYDLVLIDAKVFEREGDCLLSWRACHADHLMPVIVFGQFHDRERMLRAFDAGVSDVLVGAVEQNEMYVRTRRVLDALRAERPAPASLMVGPYTLCQRQGLVTLDGQPIYLTAREFAMAWLFFSTPGTYFSKRQLAARVWGDTVEFTERTIEQHIYKLRKKMGIGKNGPVRLHTMYTLGYRLDVDNARAEPCPFAPSPASLQYALPSRLAQTCDNF